jgi:hypothetical protein
MGEIHRGIIGIIRICGFRENKKKIRVGGPGSKKIVLDLSKIEAIRHLNMELAEEHKRDRLR